MKEYIEIVGPCSKWVDGRGWVTQIPVELLYNIIKILQKEGKIDGK